MASTITVADIQITMSVKGAGKAKGDMDRASGSIRNLGNAAHKTSGKVGQLWNSLKRIATYRLLRTALKSITQGISEGIKNLYQWSKVGDGKFASSLDRMSTALLYMKNSMAVALAPLIENVIVPLVEKLASVFVAASNKISMFVAMLKGETKYLSVATTATKEYAQAQRSILGFDEINKLNGNTSDYSNMFKYVDLPTDNSGLSKAVEIVTSVKLKVQDILPEFDGLTGVGIAGAIFLGIKGLIAGIKALSLSAATGGTGVMVLGIAAALGLTFANLAANFKGLSGEDLKAKVLNAVNILAMGIIGFAIGGFTGGLLAINIAVLLSMLVEKVIFPTDGTGELTSQIHQGIRAVLASCLGGIGGFLIGGSAIAMGYGMAIPILLSLLLSDTTLINNSGITAKGLTDLLIGALLGVGVGALATVMGASVLSAGLIGLTVGVVLTLTLSKIQTAWENGQIKYTEWGEMYYDPNAGVGQHKGTVGSGKAGRSGTFANGGYPTEGSMFIAGEAGPELVGTIGGRTGVMNADQMAMSLAAANEGVVEAIYQIASTLTNAINNQPVPSIKIGDREIYKASQRGARTIGGKLVQGV